MKLNAVLIFGLLLAMAAPAFAKEIGIQGRVYVNSCGYFSNRAGDFKVLYKNEKLPADAQVAVVYGLGGSQFNQNFDWDGQKLVPLKKVEEGTFVGGFSVALESRGTPKSFSALNFAYVIKLADGRRFVDDGSGYNGGFYSVPLETAGCASGEELPPMKLLTIRHVDRIFRY